MEQLFKYLLILHVAGGGAGLVAGTTAAAVKKGGKVHLLAGKIFSVGMIVASISALVLSNLPAHHNIFLFAVGGFSLYMVLTGHRIVYLKRATREKDNPLGLQDFLITLFGISFAIFLIFQAAKGFGTGNTFSIIPGVFGLICLRLVYADLRLFMGSVTIKQTWMYSHIGRMMGALIASYTAFLVVNVQIRMQWILWLLPSVIGSIFITYFVRKYVGNRKK